ncbi:MAG: 1-acyl-sn-glycerol-3-phosphate acyltransferase [Bacteroidota bacterium]
MSKLINIEKVILDKSPVLGKFIPSFIINYLKKIIHQDEFNANLDKHEKLVGIDFIYASLSDINVNVDIIGLENIPKNGRTIVASNHPLGGLDGLALMLAVAKRRKDIIFPVNDLLMNVKNLEPLFIPINKHGSNTDNIQIINDTFASEKIICYFPFGLVSRKKKGKIMDLNWKSTFISKAKRYKRDIIPTHIDGKNSNFFYNLSNIRKALGIKINLEMLFLVDEMYKQKNSTLKITFGKPIPYSTFDKRHSNIEWAELMRQFTYKLGENGNAQFM